MLRPAHDAAYRVDGVKPWDSLADLPLTIESYEVERLAAPGVLRLERVTTRVRLQGGGEEGLGEDVSPFRGRDHTLHAMGPVLALAGEWTLGVFCEHLQPMEQWRAAARVGDCDAGATGRSSRPRSISRCARPVRRCMR